MILILTLAESITFFLKKTANFKYSMIAACLLLQYNIVTYRENDMILTRVGDTGRRWSASNFRL